MPKPVVIYTPCVNDPYPVTASVAFGAAVPIPTLPPAVVTNVLAGVPWLSMTPVPFRVSPPANVDVAVVEVAVIIETVVDPNEALPGDEIEAHGLVVPMPRLWLAVKTEVLMPAVSKISQMLAV